MGGATGAGGGTETVTVIEETITPGPTVHRQERQKAVRHNGGHSGGVVIQEINEEGDPIRLQIRLPFEVMRHVVAGYVRDRRVARLEDADLDKVLGIRG